MKGSWTIDPNVSVPPALLSAIPDGEVRDNVFVKSQNAAVNVGLRLISDSDKPTKSTLRACSTYGTVTVKILSRSNQYFRLIAQSQNGAVNVYIPRDFEGPVSFTNEQPHFGRTRFSELVQRRLTHLSREAKSGKAFIGSWDAANQDADGEPGSEWWRGDELVLSSMYGQITVAFLDEAPPESENVGPLGGLFRFARRRFGGGASVDTTGNASGSTSPVTTASGTLNISATEKN